MSKDDNDSSDDQQPETYLQDHFAAKVVKAQDEPISQRLVQMNKISVKSGETFVLHEKKLLSLPLPKNNVVPFDASEQGLVAARASVMEAPVKLPRRLLTPEQSESISITEISTNNILFSQNPTRPSKKHRKT